MKAPKQIIEKSVLGIAGEFAVATELCRRNIYAQLTLGNQKRADLIVMTENNNFVKIEVKSKQGPTWPNCKGICGQNVFLMFVDFYGKKPTDRPDFYVMGLKDWKAYVKVSQKVFLMKHPGRKAEVSERNVLVLPNEINRHGTPYSGCGVSLGKIEQHKEAW